MKLPRGGVREVSDVSIDGFIDRFRVLQKRVLGQFLVAIITNMTFIFYIKVIFKVKYKVEDRPARGTNYRPEFPT